MISIYGLLGYPVKHSLSPAMQNAAFKTLNLDSEYRLFEKKEEEVEIFFSSLPEKHIQGFNVTYPYKESIKSFLDECTEEARSIGAVNTVRIEKEKKTGHNTDGNGFLMHLAGVYRDNLDGLSVSLLGAGGAAKAIAFSLAGKGVSRLLVYDVRKDKSEELSSHMNRLFSFNRVQAVASIDELQEHNPELFINATPVGMKEEDPLLIKPEKLFPCTFVYDLIYNPAETRLLRAARSRGCGCSNGLGMLLYQGVLAFEFWTGLEAPVDVMRRALEQAVHDSW